MTAVSALILSMTVYVQPAAAAAPPPDSEFQKVPLDTNTGGNPMMLDIAPDGRVFYVDRLGDVRVIRPGGGTVLAAHLDVFTANESGLLSIALDPGFTTNHWVYLYYSPNAVSVDRLSRFTVAGDTVDLGTEKVVLDVPVQRAECCHHGAGLAIDKSSGNLWLSTGDNTNPFESDGYAPLDQNPGRANFDAERTAGNTNSLSGKVLRIHPEANGTYTIPAGNLFPPGTAKTRPEIYMMGERNPFRMGLDPKTGYAMVANYGPDADAADPARGPQNTVEWDLLSSPRNGGWPFCIGPNQPYIGASGAPFDCAGGPTNSSPNNTGLTKLPPAVPATVYYHYAADPAHFPQLSGGAPMAGPVYRYDPNLTSARKWPQYFDGRAMFADWGTGKMYTFQLTADGKAVASIDPLLSSFTFLKPMDFKFGPDGALYLIEWGSGFGGDNTDSGVYRIDHVGGSASPIAQASADHTNGHAPLTVAFSSAGSSGTGYSWTFGDGGTSTAPNPTHTYTGNGNYTAVLTVRNAAGQTSSASVAITVGNTAPTVTFTAPPNGGSFQWGDQVKYSVNVTDAEDGTINCADVHVQAILGHDTHGHPLDAYTGCSGTVTTRLTSGHSASDNVFFVLEASYTDKGGAGGAAPLTTRSQVLLYPKHFSLRAHANNQLVTAENAGKSPLIANRSAIGDWEQFDVLDQGDGTVALRAHADNQYVTAENAGNDPLIANRTAVGAWEKFQLVHNSDGSVSLKAGANGHYVTAENGGAAPLIANRTAIGPWEKFDLVTQVVSLRAHANNQLVTAENAGKSPLIANRSAVGTWEQFDVVDLGDGTVALRAHADNQYVTAENAGNSALVANRGAVGAWEKFQLVHNADGSVSLKAGVNGHYVTAENGGAAPLIANRTAIGPWEEFDLRAS